MPRGTGSRHFANALKLRYSAGLSVFVWLLLLGGASRLVGAGNFGPVFGKLRDGCSGSGDRNTQSLSFTVPSGITLGDISALTLGAANLDFTVVAGGSCASGSTDSTCTVQVQFLPVAPGPRLGAVVLSGQSGDTLIAVPLYGRGSAPLVAFGPGTITTVAGDGSCSVLDANGNCYSGDGGAAGSAELHLPSAIVVGGTGALYIADSDNNVIREVTPGGVITTVAGNGICAEPLGGCYSGDHGPATRAQLAHPLGAALDGAGNLYIADTYNNVIRKVTPGGVITTVAGNYAAGAGFSGDHGPATSAQLNGPSGITVDGAGDLYIADTKNNAIRRVTASGVITTVAGRSSGCPQQTDGWGDGCPATSAELLSPSGVAVDEAGDFYIADQLNNLVREVTSGGLMIRVAGNGQNNGDSGDGGAATNAELNQPAGVALDGAGNLYIADSTDCVIRKVTPGGTITTVAGVLGKLGGAGDNGPATSALLEYPSGVALDGSGNLYLADSGNGRIRKVDVADAPSLSFTNTNPGQVSVAQDATVLNLGDAALTISQISTATFFTLGGADTTCSTSGQVLDAAASCVLGIQFSPAEPGNVSGSVVLTDDTLNANPSNQSISLQGNTIILKPQRISFPNPGPVTYGVGSVALTATASSGLAVSYAVVNGPASLSGSTLIINGAGVVMVQADQAGNATYDAARPAYIFLTVNPAALTVVANNQVAALGAAIPALTGTITGVFGGDGITASYSTSAVAGLRWNLCDQPGTARSE